MQFDYFVSRAHDDFYRDNGGGTDNPRKAAFSYLVGVSPTLREKYSAFFDPALNAVMPSRAGELSAADSALLAIAADVLDPVDCPFVLSFLALDDNAQRAVVEALGQLIGQQKT